MARLAKDTPLWIVARFHGMLSWERGQTLAEYGLIITIVAVGTTVLGMVAFRNQLMTGFDSMANCLTGGC